MRMAKSNPSRGMAAAKKTRKRVGREGGNAARAVNREEAMHQEPQNNDSSTSRADSD